MEQGPWTGDDAAVVVRVDWGGTLPLPLAGDEMGEGDGVVALFVAEFWSERRAWRALRVPTSSTAGAKAPSPLSASPLPFPSAPALTACACLCPSALDAATLYTVCKRTGLPSAWRQGHGDGTKPFASVVLKKGEYPASRLWPPTAVCAFLPRPSFAASVPAEKVPAEKGEEEEEWLAVHHGRDVLGRLYLFRRCVRCVRCVPSCLACV